MSDPLRYNDPEKQKAWEDYKHGFIEARGVESIQGISIRAANSQFERYWELNRS